MIVGIEFTDTINLGAVVIGGIIGIATVANIIAGGRKWKDIADAEKVERARAESERDSIRDQFAQVHEQNLKLNDVIQVIGGAKVYEAVKLADESAAKRTEQSMQEIARLFEMTQRAAEAREARSVERHSQTLKLFDTVGHVLAELQTNGKEER